jgi:hypothetical protein
VLAELAEAIGAAAFTSRTPSITTPPEEGARVERTLTIPARHPNRTRQPLEARERPSMPQRNLSFNKEKPPAVSCRGPPSVSSLSGSEVTLSANVQEHSALVPELVDRGRLRSRRSENRNARHLLVEEERADFSRERQVLDGSPTGNHTNLGNVVVRVAGKACALADGVVGAPRTLGRGDVQHGAAVAHRGVAAPDAGRPVGIPIVVERTTDTPCIHQLELAARHEDRISRLTEADALVSTSNTRVAEHREARRGTARGDHGFSGTMGVGGVDLDVVACTGRQVLDLQRSHHRTAPLVFGVTGDFRQSSRNAAGTEDVVGSVHEMRHT